MEEGCRLSIYDPRVTKEQIDMELEINNQITTFKDKFDSRWEKNTSVYESALNSDAILLLTDWDEFYEMDLKKLFSNMRIPCWILIQEILSIQRRRNP